MFGTYRTFLALAVVVHHLISIPVIGQYAVHGFFILSGYLMTYIMKHSYGYSLNGIKSFATNRFLRLYPSYWFVLVASVIAVWFFGEANAISYREFIAFPDSVVSAAQNITLVYFNLFPGAESPRLSPPTWALTIELLFYLLIALGLSRTKATTTIWFVVSLIYMTLTHVLELGFAYRYNIIFAGSLPFSMGAMIAHYYQSSWLDWARAKGRFDVILLAILFVLNSGFAAVYSKLGLPDFVTSLTFYANYLINAGIIIKLIDGKLPFVSRKLDTAIGNYSYPIYLIHWQAGFVASMLIWGEPLRGFNLEGIVALGLALVICFALSYLTIRLIDVPVENLRKKIKRKANQGLAD